MNKIKAAGQTNYANKGSTLTVRQLIDELEQYDDNIPVLADAGHKYGAFFIEQVKLEGDWLHIGKRF